VCTVFLTPQAAWKLSVLCLGVLAGQPLAGGGSGPVHVMWGQQGVGHMGIKQPLVLIGRQAAGTVVLECSS